MFKSQNLLLLTAIALLSLIATSPAAAQVYQQNGGVAIPPTKTVNTPPPNLYGGYMIGVGDILEIHVNDEDAVTGTYQVDQEGNVKLPLLTEPVHAAGSSTFELAGNLRDEFKKQQILREPSVTVMIIRGMTENVSVLGAVLRPGTYPIEKPTTVMELISMAGGLAPNAGNVLTITHGGVTPSSSTPAVVNASARTSAVHESSINVTELMSGRQPALNARLEAGDVVTVATAPVVFVVGAVVRPGAFSIQEQRAEISVLQAVAMALGPSPVASLSKAIIIRKSTSEGERQEIPLDLKKIMHGKDQDKVLLANDILFVPQSNLKASMRRMGDIGASAATSAAGYAIFY